MPFNPPLRPSGSLGFEDLSLIFYFMVTIGTGSGLHCMIHSHSDGVEGSFQLSGSGGIEAMFQWF